MLLTVFSLLSYLTLFISAAPGYVHEKRPGYSAYYPGRRNVSPRSVSINSRYSHAIRTRANGGGGPGGGPGGGNHYGGPQPILQTATTLINVHPTPSTGYRKCARGNGDCGPHEERHASEEHAMPRPPVQTEPPQPPQPPMTSTTPPSTTTTTELNMYQAGNRVVNFRASVPSVNPPYPPYQPPPPPVYEPPPPPPRYIPPPPPPPPRYIPPPPPPPPPPPAASPTTVIRIGDVKDDDEYGKKKYKVLICKLQQK